VDRNAVLAKTAKGGEELKSRTHGLPQKLRSLLIMVDGSSTAGELVARLGGIPELEAALRTLVDQGFLEIRGQAVPAGGASTAAPLPAPAAQPPQTRQQALSALTRMLHDAIGPDADLLTGPLERAKTRAEFVAAVERSTETLAALAGKARAETFGARAAAFAAQYFAGG